MKQAIRAALRWGTSAFVVVMLIAGIVFKVFFAETPGFVALVSSCFAGLIASVIASSIAFDIALAAEKPEEKPSHTDRPIKCDGLYDAPDSSDN